MRGNRRRSDRVNFELGYSARILAIDATWQRECLIEDISESGAKCLLDGSIADLSVNEFFLVLSRVGTAHRRCKLVWINGDEIGVQFIKKADANTRSHHLSSSNLVLRGP